LHLQSNANFFSLYSSGGEGLGEEASVKSLLKHYTRMASNSGGLKARIGTRIVESAINVKRIEKA
jgi:hypothetical protein